MAVTTQPGRSQLVLVGVEGHRSWSTGMFGCFTDCSSCLCTNCCLPLMMCRLASCPLMPCCLPCSIVAMRTKIRTMGGIEGSICGDCVVSSCCFTCTVCQLSRELDHMGI